MTTADATRLPVLAVPAPNPAVLGLLARCPLRDPVTAAGRVLYLQRLGLVVVAQQRVGIDAGIDAGIGAGAGWVCTAAAGPLDTRAPVGALRVDDVEIAAALEVRDPLYPLADLAAAQVCAAWWVRVWDRWPGGRIVQVAQALLEAVDPATLTVATGPAHGAELARRAGLPHPRGITRHCTGLAAAGLLTALDAGSSRRYRLRLPPFGVVSS